jgi:endonuclease YncB( thermonuclease family)
MRHLHRISTTVLILWLLMAATGFPWNAKVISVSDGDTIAVLTGTQQTKIRLHGIDCPESGQDFGRLAKRVTSDLCFGKMVRVEPTDTDRYGRTVAIVYLEDGRELNLELIKAGVAWYFKRYSDDPRYAEAEIQARKAGIGLFRNGKAIPSRELHRDQRGSTEGRVNSLPGWHGTSDPAFSWDRTVAASRARSALRSRDISRPPSPCSDRKTWLQKWHPR